MTAPDAASTRRRLGVEGEAQPVLQVMKRPFTRRMAASCPWVRVLSGWITDATELWECVRQDRPRIGPSTGLLGREQIKLRPRRHRRDHRARQAGRTSPLAPPCPAAKARPGSFGELDPPPPVYLPWRCGPRRDRKNEVKLSTSLRGWPKKTRRCASQQNPETAETLLFPAMARCICASPSRNLESKYQIRREARRPSVPLCRDDPDIDLATRGRHKKQSRRAHGQFGDVVLDIKSRCRAGARFSNSPTSHHRRRGAQNSSTSPQCREREGGLRGGGACAISPEIRAALGLPGRRRRRQFVGRLLSRGRFVDMAFQQAARLAMKEGLAACSPVVWSRSSRVEVYTPSEATPRVTAIVSQRRGRRYWASTRVRAGFAGTWWRD